MRPAYFAALALLVGCRARPDVKAPQSAAAADLAQFTRDSTDSVLHAPRVVTGPTVIVFWLRSEEHTSELQSLAYLVCRLLLEKKKKKKRQKNIPEKKTQYSQLTPNHSS